MFWIFKKKEEKIYEAKPLHPPQKLKEDTEKQIASIFDSLYEKHGILMTRIQVQREDSFSGDPDKKFPSEVKHKISLTFEI